MPSLMSTFWFARTATRSHMVYSVSRSWVTRNTVRPSALRRVRINGRKMQPRLDPVLRWVRQETGCSHQAPRLSPVLLVSPCLRTTRPDTCLPLRQATPKPSLLLAKRSARGRARPTCSIKGRATFSKTVSDEYNAPFWNRMPNLRSIRARASHWARSRSRPRYGPRPNAASAARRRYARARISRCLTLPPRQGFPRAARPGLGLMDLLGSKPVVQAAHFNSVSHTVVGVLLHRAHQPISMKNSAAMASIRITMKIDCTTLTSCGRLPTQRYRRP